MSFNSVSSHETFISFPSVTKQTYVRFTLSLHKWHETHLSEQMKKRYPHLFFNFDDRILYKRNDLYKQFDVNVL